LSIGNFIFLGKNISTSRQFEGEQTKNGGELMADYTIASIPYNNDIPLLHALIRPRTFSQGSNKDNNIQLHLK
jgi:hypothetical protein